MHSVRHFRSGGRANARKVQKRTMDKKGKQQFLLVAFGVALYAALMNLNEVAAFLTRLATLFTPVIIGLLMAFVLSVPMQGIAGRLTRLMPKAKEKHIDLLSLLLTLLCVVIVVVLLCVLALPQLAASLKSIGTLVQGELAGLGAPSLGSRRGYKRAHRSHRRARLENGAGKGAHRAGALIDSVVDLAGTTVSAVANVTFAIVIMFYVLLDRRSLAKQSRRLLYANLSERKADQVCRIARLTHTTYARFLSGQCVEVVILGTMIFLAFSLCGIPYAGLTAALTAAFCLCSLHRRAGLLRNRRTADAACPAGEGAAVPDRLSGGAVHGKSVHLPACGWQQRGACAAVDAPCGIAWRQALRPCRYCVFHSPHGGSTPART